MPSEIRNIIRDAYGRYDLAMARSSDLLNQIKQLAFHMLWETDDSTIPGDEMVRILTTAPQVGEITAITWLAHVITPRRFQNSKAMAAYCGLDPSLKISAGKVTSTVKRGGCRELHKVLVSSADRLIRNHSELFGKWGYALFCQTGKWKKAANAVARKLATALYFMMKSGKEFSYHNYNLIKSIGVFDIKVDDLPSLNPDFKRYIRILKEHGILTTNDMVMAYLKCELGQFHGLGRKFFSVIRDYLNNQPKYQKIYHQLHDERGEHYEQNASSTDSSTSSPPAGT